MNTPAKRHQYRAFPDGIIPSEKRHLAEMKDHAKRVLHTLVTCTTGARDQYAQIQALADDVLVIADYVKSRETRIQVLEVALRDAELRMRCSLGLLKCDAEFIDRETEMVRAALSAQ